MSVWGDIRRRADGRSARQEDNERTIIRDILKEHCVGPGMDFPLRQFKVEILKDDDNKLHQYAIVLEACIHPDGTKDFCNEENIGHMLKILKLGRIIEIS